MVVEIGDTVLSGIVQVGASDELATRISERR